MREKILIVCIVFRLSITIGMKLIRTTQHIDFGPGVKSDSVLISDYNNFANPGLVYGVCNVNTNLSNVFVCQMFMEMKIALGIPEHHVRSCNVTVKRLTAGHTVHPSVVVLDDDTAVIIPREYNSSSLTFLHFPDCRTRTVDLQYDLSSARVLAPLDNVFDLIGVDDDDAKCFSDCRIIVDFNGTVMSKAHKWLRHYQYEYAALQSPIRGRLLVSTLSTFVEPAVVISAVNDEGEAVMLKTYPTDCEATIGNKITTSTTHQLLSACAAVNLTVTCGQFDFTGFLALQINFTVAEFTRLHSIKVFNLPEGGLLLLYTECSRNNSQSATENNCRYGRENVFVKKIDITGQQSGTLEITQFRGSDVLKTLHFFVSEDDSLCFSQPYLADKFEDNGQVTLDVVCFENTEFSG